MERWDLPSIEATGKREPRVLFSKPECRGVVIDLQPGDEMGDHSVHERAVVQVVSGAVSVECGGQEVECRAGTLVTFEPGERHALRSLEASRIMLLLAPWPGAGHYQTGTSPDPERLPAHATAPSVDS